MSSNCLWVVGDDHREEEEEAEEGGAAQECEALSLLC